MPDVYKVQGATGCLKDKAPGKVQQRSCLSFCSSTHICLGRLAGLGAFPGCCSYERQPRLQAALTRVALCRAHLTQHWQQRLHNQSST